MPPSVFGGFRRLENQNIDIIILVNPMTAIPQNTYALLVFAFSEDDSFSTTQNPEENPYHLRCLRGHEGPIRAIAARGRTVVSGSYDHTLRVWDIEAGTCTWVLTGHSGKGMYILKYHGSQSQ